jgi:hypothetical protein
MSGPREKNKPSESSDGSSEAVFPDTKQQRHRNLTLCARMAPTLIALSLWTADVALSADAPFENGWWKTEVVAGIGFDASTVNRAGDRLVTALVEYEVPVARRYTLGLGMIPLLWYESRRENGEEVVGGGLGLSGRRYRLDGKYRGWYVEAKGYCILLDPEIPANTSKFNFFIGGGLGYRFQNHWQTAVKFEHISNGGLGSRNQSLNTISLSLGYNF